MKQENDISRTGGITFSWKELDCEEWNGALAGYEIKLYYEDEVHTERVVEFVTTFTIQPNSMLKFSFPKAISVAAINEVGVGNHCPLVKISLFGENEIDPACIKCYMSVCEKLEISRSSHITVHAGNTPEGACCHNMVSYVPGPSITHRPML